jgi:hypothetical protein
MPRSGPRKIYRYSDEFRLSTPAAAPHSSCGTVRRSVACSARNTTRRTGGAHHVVAVVNGDMLGRNHPDTALLLGS